MPEMGQNPRLSSLTGPSTFLYSIQFHNFPTKCYFGTTYFSGFTRKYNYQKHAV